MWAILVHEIIKNLIWMAKMIRDLSKTLGKTYKSIKTPKTPKL